jgi:hypothetical protein
MERAAALVENEGLRVSCSKFIEFLYIKRLKLIVPSNDMINHHFIL